MSRELPVVIPLRDGQSVCGILHEPGDPGSRRIGIQLLNPGLKSRVAPNRLNVILARRLAGRGFFVLRVDPPGIGDSTGSLDEASRNDLWKDVEHGLWSGLMDEVNRRFMEECRLDELMMIGNCGGAITALLAAVESTVVDRLVLVDIPVADRAEQTDAPSQVFGETHGRKILGSYLKRLRNPGAWIRLLTFKTDFRTVAGALKARFAGAGGSNPANRRKLSGSMKQLLHMEGINRQFAEAFIGFHQRGGRILFVHAGEDEATIIFNRLVGDRFMAAGLPLAKHPRIVIPEANHIYGTGATRTNLIRSIEDWITEGASDGHQQDSSTR